MHKESCGRDRAAFCDKPVGAPPVCKGASPGAVIFEVEFRAAAEKEADLRRNQADEYMDEYHS
jgi:hypothetical protein